MEAGAIVNANVQQCLDFYFHDTPHLESSAFNFTRAVCTVFIMKRLYRCFFSTLYFIRSSVRSSPLCPAALERRILLGRNDLEALHYNTVTDTGKLHPRRVSSAFDQLIVGLLLPEDLGWWRSAARHQADPGVGPLELVKLPPMCKSARTAQVMEPS